MVGPALVCQTKSGKAENHAARVHAAQRAIDQALGAEKETLSLQNERGRQLRQPHNARKLELELLFYSIILRKQGGGNHGPNPVPAV
jgi:methylphosphotriester-DNA--protein-cysteine methyltransferase